ncbi:MAG: RluA family pseudouridine synthase [Polyangiaceae bacterium]|nr:RluA family pseudouridine synthase [Polyangiaceae bacterium]
MTRISARELSGTEGPFGRGTTIVRPAGVPEGSVVSVMRVPPECAGMRLDRFVQSQLRRTSRTRTQAILKRGAFSPDARPLKANDRVQAEQAILLWRPPWDEAAEPTDMPILYEDDYLTAVGKPAGIVVHPTARYYASTVVKRLEARRPGERIFPAHRLDRETSGVLLLSRTPEADRNVKVQFESRHSVSKQYIAICWGQATAQRFLIDKPMTLDPDAKYKVKMHIAEPGKGLTAATECELVGIRRDIKTGRPYSMIRCNLLTGRQHQIRLHLASINLPIVGDKLYGPDDNLFARGVDDQLTPEDHALLELPRHALHAEQLGLNHPITGERLTIRANLPADLQEFWNGLGPE